MKTIEQRLLEAEGSRRFPYVDCCGKRWTVCVCHVKGKLTIGVGRNLDEVGISQAEIETLLQHDLARVRSELDIALPWWRTMDEPRRIVLQELGFNLGVLTPPESAHLMDFAPTLELIRKGEYAQAAARLKLSKWHSQVGQRALDLESLLMLPSSI